MSALSRLRRYFSLRPEPSRPTDDQWALAKQGAAKLTVDELRAIKHVAASNAHWPGLIDWCFSHGLDRPFALD